MKFTFNIALCFALLGGLSPTMAFAHHSGAMYDNQQMKIIEGVVKEFLWINPHVMMWVVVPAKDGEPAQTWQLENTSPGRLSRGGWNKDSFKPGDKIRVEFRPLRNGKPGGYFSRSTSLDTNEVLELKRDY